jgi:hypothetical protein
MVESMTFSPRYKQIGPVGESSQQFANDCMLREVGVFGGGKARRNHANECNAQKGPPAEEGPGSSHVRSNAVIEFQQPGFGFCGRARIAEAQRRRWRDYREMRQGVSLAGTPVVKEQGSD